MVLRLVAVVIVKDNTFQNIGTVSCTADLLAIDEEYKS